MGNYSQNPEDVLAKAVKNNYVGVRFQQGKPILDRELNLLADLSNPQRLAQHYIGNGVPDDGNGDNSGFQIANLDINNNNFTIKAGRCLVNGLEVVLPADTTYQSQPNKTHIAKQLSLADVPPPEGSTNASPTLRVVTLHVTTREISESEDPELKNETDVGFETTLREQVDWEVLVTRAGDASVTGPDYFPLAQFDLLDEKSLTDLRITGLSLAKLRQEFTAGKQTSNLSVQSLLASDNISVGTAALMTGSKLTASATSNHLQLRRENTETAGGKILYLELYQDDPQNKVPEVWPSLRFHHNNKFWHRIEAQSNGVHFKDGNLSSDSQISIFAGNATIDGTTTTGSTLHVGPIVLPPTSGRVNASGNGAEFSFMRRTLTAWPAQPAAGDRFVWYNQNGTAALWTEAIGDLLAVTSKGDVGIGTITPKAKLEVNGALIVDGDIIVRGNATIPGLQGGGGGGADTSGLSNVLKVSGSNVGIGTPTPRASLEVAGGAIMPSAGKDGSDNKSGIQFPPDPGGGAWDEAFIRYYPVSGETMKLRIGINNDPDDSIGFWQAGAEQLTLINGKVGVGTTAPLNELHVVAPGGFGGENADGTSLAGNVPIVAQSNGTAFGIVNGSGRQAFALNIEGDGATSAARGVPTFFDKFDGNWHSSLSLKNGNVCIGTATPGARLTVSNTDNHLQLRRESTETTGGKILFLELIQNDPQNKVPYVWPSLRFHHNNKFWHRIEAQPNGFHFKEGNLAGDGHVSIFAKNLDTSGGDLAENYLSDMDLAPGDVVCLDSQRDRVVPSEKANDVAVIGVISSEPGVLINSMQEQEESLKDGMLAYPVALCGRVFCKVTDENGPIKRGDVLTTSSTSGHAMKAKPVTVSGIEIYRPGTIIGKALASHAKGKGMIEVFIAGR